MMKARDIMKTVTHKILSLALALKSSVIQLAEAVSFTNTA
jgi:hypothetical protein